MVTALAGLRKGTITRWTQIYDSGIFTKYDNEVNQWFAPKCWLYNEVGVGHGALDVVGALQNSCNVFFYDVGDRTGVEYLNAAAADFGLGSKTGLEINERPGVLADEAYKLQEFGANEGWRAADNVLTAIGQGYSVFTPAQLANYIATIANGGVRHSLTLLKCVKSADYAATTYAQTPVVANVIQETEYLSYLQEGMRAVATSGTAANVFGNYQVKVAAKTGSVQATLQEFANGIFVCYAPADKPEIAVAVVVEKGGSGAAVMEIAKAVLDEYFDAGVTVGIPSDGALLP
jgi:penicillin-binding protein 2